MQQVTNLTRYPPASVREVWSISIPLMLTALSGAIMLFLDRLILAHYSLDAMNAVAAVGINCSIFQFSAVSITSIAEVFVGRYHGAKQFDRVAQPVWQMVWFSCATAFVFIPIGLWGGPIIVPNAFEAIGLPYFELLMLFGPLLPLHAAFSSFFVGRGKTALVISAAVIGNLLNLILDIILIFGFDPYIPSLGPLGAAIATVIAQAIQMLILGIAFVLPKYQKQFKTRRLSLRPKLLWQCLKIGVPNAAAHSMEIAAWAFLFFLVAKIGTDYVTILAVGQSIYILFAFLTDGMEKGITALASNFLGAEVKSLIPKLFRSSLNVLAVILLVIAVPLIFSSDLLISGFSVPPHLYGPMQISLTWIWLFFVFDGIVWVLAGLLTAGGDTRFIMIMNSLTVWVLAIAPIYVFVILQEGSLYLPWAIIAISAILNSICFYWRYRSGRWLKLVTP